MKRFVVSRYGWDLAVDTEQLVDGRLGRSHRILDRKDGVGREIFPPGSLPSRIMKAATARDPMPPPTR
jgi:hypothetical protein